MTLSPAQHAALFAALSDGVLVMDADGRVVHADERFSAITGYPADACRGATPPFAWWPDEPPGALHDGAEAVIRRRDGRPVAVRVTDRLVAGSGAGAGGRVRLVRAVDDDASAAARWRRAAAEATALRRVAEAGGRAADAAAVLQLAAHEAADLLDARAVAIYRDEAGAARLVAAAGEAAAATLGAVEHPADGSTLAALMRGDAWAATADAAGVQLPAGAGARGMMVVHAPAGGPARCRDVLARLAEALGPAVAAVEARLQLARQAASDSLTGLADNRTFHRRLGDEVARARRHGRPLALCVLDIDNFKEINDVHGHQAGDRALVRVADHLRQVARAGDLVARVGGDEFAWVLPEAGGARALEAAGRLRARVAAMAVADDVRLTISAGVCDLADARDAPDLFRLADGALYWAKVQGRDQSRLYDAGADDVLSSRERLRRSRRVQAAAMLCALADKVDAMHADGDHSQRVAALAVRLAAAVGWPEDAAARLREAARLHDVGKVGLPAAPPPRTIDEAIVGDAGERFARLGADLVADALDAEQCAWIRDQRLRYDARVRSPDPRPYGGEIIAVADAWDVGLGVAGSDEAGRAALFAALSRRAGGRFCPRVVAALGDIGMAGDLGASECGVA